MMICGEATLDFDAGWPHWLCPVTGKECDEGCEDPATAFDYEEKNAKTI